MLTFEEWRHTYADVFETDDAARAAWTAACNRGYRTGVQDTRELLAAHSAGAQEPVAWRYQSEDPLDGGEWLLSDMKPNRRNIQPLYTHPQPMSQTDAYRHLSNLLARIHRDGGHYEAQHGIAKAVADADDKVAKLNAQTDAARDVLAERARQVSVEGWTPEHDDKHKPGVLTQAACSYLDDAVVKLTRLGQPGIHSVLWPWDESWWKPSTARRNLVKAAALILAEIERIDRAKEE